MERLLVIGGTGYLGAALCQQARDLGISVHATSHRGGAVRGVATSTLDVRDAAAVGHLIDEVAPGTVINTAYVQDAPEARAVNVGGARNVAEASWARGVRLLHMSSDVVFDGSSSDPIDETAMLSPVHDYGRSKADGEAQVLAAHPRASVVRTSLIIGGPGSPPSMHERVIHEVCRGERAMRFFVDEFRCPVQVDDLARALLALADTEHVGPVHIAGPDVVSRHELALLVAEGHGDDPGSLEPAHVPPQRPASLVLAGHLFGRLVPDVRLRGVREVFGAPAPGPAARKAGA